MSTHEPIAAESLADLLRACRPAVRSALESALSGQEIGVSDACTLFGAVGGEITALQRAADLRRQQRVGQDVSFAVVRNINFTNVCYMGCRFCGFAKRKSDLGAYWLSLEEVADRAQVAWQRAASEVCMQGGLHPELPTTYYRDLVRAVKQRVPQIHIHAFSPFEIWFGARKRKWSVRDFLRELKDVGLGSIPGTAAEILDTEIRRKLTRDKLTASAWVETIEAAHEIGLRSTSTIMYGHIDGPEHWAAHLDLIRTIQKRTGGFTEFVPLGFVHAESPLYVNKAIPGVRSGASHAENLKMHAMARLMLSPWIDNVQASWVKLGPQAVLETLRSGVNDLGGTLMDETISRSAGSSFGEELTPIEMVKLIRYAGRRPVRRSTLYEVLENYDDHDPVDLGPLKPRPADPIRFLRKAAVGEGV